MAPSASVLVCGNPRCGSSLLTSLLTSAGAGRPAEYFWRDDIASFKQKWKVSSPEEYVQRVLQAGTSETGVFAMKLMWGHLNELFLYLRAYTADYESGDLRLIRLVFPEPRFVWVRREDVVAQAVSWWKAIQTGQWWAGQEATGECEAVYGFEQIDWLVTQVRVYDGSWSRWFHAHRIAPTEIVYERLCSDQEGTTSAVLSALGLEAVAGAQIAPMAGLLKQADEINAQWAARYRRESSNRRAS